MAATPSSNFALNFKHKTVHFTDILVSLPIDHFVLFLGDFCFVFTCSHLVTGLWRIGGMEGSVFSLKLTLIGPALKTGSKVCSEFHPQFPTCTTECFTCTRNTKHSRQRIQNTCTRNTKHSRHLERIQDQGQTHRLYHVCAFSKTQFLWQHIWQLVNWKQQQWFPNLSKLKRVQPAVLRGNS